MFRRRVQPEGPRRLQPAAKRLRVEMLESRHMLSGVVNVEIAPVGLPGTLTLEGSVDNNHVEIHQGVAAGEYVITGLNNTLLQVNGAGVTMPTVTVNGINGDITVELNGGGDVFEFQGPSSVPTNLQITNDGGGDENIIEGVTINGDLVVQKAFGDDGFSGLKIIDTTVIGDTLVDNNVGGGDGGSNTFIEDSVFQAGSGTTALTIINGEGADILQIQGNSTFGSGVFPPGFVALTVVNGSGGSRTTLTGTSVVYGDMEIFNGPNIMATEDIVTFNNAEVLGAVTVRNDGGNSSTSVQQSSLGTDMINGGPLLVLNNEGVDAFFMEESEIPWGLGIHNDFAGGGTSLWGSSTDIRNSFIGTHPTMPMLPMPPALPGDAMLIYGDDAADVVTLLGTVVGGEFRMFLEDGNNEVTIRQSDMASLHVDTGAGNDMVTLEDALIPVALEIRLYAGADQLEVRGNSVLPDLLYGTIVIDGGIGIDTYGHDTTIIPPVLPISNFERTIP